MSKSQLCGLEKEEVERKSKEMMVAEVRGKQMIKR